MFSVTIFLFTFIFLSTTSSCSGKGIGLMKKITYLKYFGFKRQICIFFLNNHFFQDSDHPRHNEVWDPPRYEAEKAIASPGKGWGFCSEECDKLDSQPSGVKYYGLGLMAYLSDKECENYLGVNINIHNNTFPIGIHFF